MRFKVKIEKGKISGSSFIEYITQLKDNFYTIDVQRLKRSNEQNALYWLYLGVIEKETGDNANDLHEYFKRKFLPPRFKRILGRDIKLPSSTTELNKLDFGEYMEKICALTGIPIPSMEELKR